MVVTFIFQAEDGIRDGHVTGVQTCALPILSAIAEVPDADSDDAVTRAALTERLGLQIERADQHLDIAMVNNLASTLQIRDVLDQMPSATADDWEVIAERMAGFPRSLRSWGESLLEAAGAGVVSARRQLQLGAEQARGYAATFFPAFARGAVGSPAQRDRVTTAAAAAADGYRETAELLESLIDRAPEADAVGRDAYQLASRTFLGTEIDLEETYAWGIEELRSLIAEQESIAQQINDHHGTGGVRSIAAAKDALRADPSRVLHGTEALQAWM